MSLLTPRKPLSFHAVSFGSSNASLQRMVHIALEVQNNAKADPALTNASIIDSSFSLALDSVSDISFVRAELTMNFIRFVLRRPSWA